MVIIPRESKRENTNPYSPPLMKYLISLCTLFFSVIVIAHDPWLAQDILLNNIMIKRAAQVLVTVGRVGLLPRIRHLHQQQCSDKANQPCVLVVMQSISQQVQRVPLASEFLQKFLNQTNKAIYRQQEGNSIGKYMNDEGKCIYIKTLRNILM